MAAPNVSKRKAPHLTAVPSASKRIKFPDSDFSIVGGLLTVERKLSETTDANDALCLISEAHTSTTRAIQVIGKLMAGQSESIGAITNEEVTELGYLIHGLGHITESLEQASQDILEKHGAGALA